MYGRDKLFVSCIGNLARERWKSCQVDFAAVDFIQFSVGLGGDIRSQLSYKDLGNGTARPKAMPTCPAEVCGQG